MDLEHVTVAGVPARGGGLAGVGQSSDFSFLEDWTQGWSIIDTQDFGPIPDVSFPVPDFGVAGPTASDVAAIIKQALAAGADVARTVAQLYRTVRPAPRPLVQRAGLSNLFTTPTGETNWPMLALLGGGAFLLLRGRK